MHIPNTQWCARPEYIQFFNDRVMRGTNTFALYCIAISVQYEL